MKVSEIIYNEIISTQEKGQIIISDLGLNDDMIDLFEEIFIFLKSNLWSITWIDHHPWSEKAIKSAIEKGFVQLTLDKQKSDVLPNSCMKNSKRKFHCRRIVKNSPYYRFFYKRSRNSTII